jgi:hypothetical protein
MSIYLAWSLNLGCKVQGHNFVCIFHEQSCFVFVLYNTNIVGCYKYFVLQLARSFS